jgi:hypothetical protein
VIISTPLNRDFAPTIFERASAIRTKIINSDLIHPILRAAPFVGAVFPAPSPTLR